MATVVTASTSVVLVNSATSPIPAVYFPPISTLGRLVTVRDADGFVSTGNYIYLQGCNGVTFGGGLSTLSITQPYGFLTLSATAQNNYSILNTFAFPEGSTAAYASNVTASTLYVTNAIYSRDIVNLSTNTITTSNGQLVFNSIPTGTVTPAQLTSTTIAVEQYASNLLFINLRRLVAVGSTSNTISNVYNPNGTIIYSDNDTPWDNSQGGTGGFSNGGNDIYYGAGLWIAAGNNGGGTNSCNTGYIQWSIDGKYWVNSVSPNLNASRIRNRVYWANNLYHAVGSNVGGATSGGAYTIMYSQDGKNWLPSAGSPFFGASASFNYATSIAFGYGIWAASGVVENTTANSLLYSSDGSNWLPSITNWTSASPSAAYDVAFNGIRFVSLVKNSALVNVATSATGSNWTTTGITNGNFNNEPGYIYGTRDMWMILTPSYRRFSVDGGFTWLDVQGFPAGYPFRPYYDGELWWASVSTNTNAQSIYYSFNGSNQWFNFLTGGGFENGGYAKSFISFFSQSNLNLQLLSSMQGISINFQTSNLTACNILTSTITLNNISTAYSFYVNSIRSNAAPSNILFYTPGSGEVTYGAQTIGQNFATSNDIAIGCNAKALATYNQVNIGVQAGSNSQGTYSVAIGYQAGVKATGNQFVAIGYQAGSNTSGTTVSIGNAAGCFNQQDSTVAIGDTAGNNNQQFYATAVGYNAGSQNQQTLSVAVGAQAGYNSQQQYSVAVGASAAQLNQQSNAVAIGYSAGFTGQGSNTVAIGYNAGNSAQGPNAIAIGYQAADTNQHARSIVLNATGSSMYSSNTDALFVKPVRSNVGTYSLYYTTTSGEISYAPAAAPPGASDRFSTLFTSTLTASTIILQGGSINLKLNNSVSVGSGAGGTSQGSSGVAIGRVAGQTQGQNGIAIGDSAGNSQQDYSVAIGYIAGTTQNQNCISIGDNSGGFQKRYAIAIGSFAGSGSQDSNTVAIGASAGENNQGAYAVAIGNSAGNTNQHPNSIVLNAQNVALNSTNPSAFYVKPVRPDASPANILYYNTGSGEISYGSNSGGGSVTNQFSTLFTSTLTASTIFLEGGVVKVASGTNAIAIGNNTGAISQGNYTVAVGFNSGNSGQKLASVAVGCNAGFVNQGSNSVAIGVSAGSNTQGPWSVAIGYEAGCNVQGSTSVAIGFRAGWRSQLNSNIAIGYLAGNDSQQTSCVAIGTSAGFQSQGNYSVAIGTSAALDTQQSNSVAIGTEVGYYQQNSNSVAIGYRAGSNQQGQFSVAVGPTAGYSLQSLESVAVGNKAGFQSQSSNSVSIGSLCGYNNQRSGSVAIGYCNGFETQGSFAVAIGYSAGTSNQGIHGIAIGLNSGQETQSPQGIAIGFDAGNQTQGQQGIAIGNRAGYFNQGPNSIAIGSYAGYSGQVANSICLNASSNSVTPANAGFYVRPIRNVNTFGTQLNFDSLSFEVTYGTPASDSNVKEHIYTLSSTLDAILSLRPVEFNYKEQPSTLRRYGFIAQEVQPHFPHLISIDAQSTLGLMYDMFPPLLVSAVQSLQSTNQGLQARLDKQEQLLQALYSTLNLNP